MIAGAIVAVLAATGALEVGSGWFWMCVAIAVVGLFLLKDILVFVFSDRSDITEKLFRRPFERFGISNGQSGEGVEITPIKAFDAADSEEGL